MPDATSLCHFRRRKKKVDGYIIPANHFYKRVLEIAVQSPEILEVPAIQAITETVKPETETITAAAETPVITTVPSVTNPTQPKFSAFSLSSIRAKKELEQSTKGIIKEHSVLPTEPFTETDMLLQWNKFAQRLSDKGQKIMEALLLINDPKLNGTVITHELPNEGSKIDFESGKYELTGYLRGKLHNHDITIEVIVDENQKTRKAFTPQDRFNRLNEINPSLELLRKTFDLDI